MIGDLPVPVPLLLDERSSTPFRAVFGHLLSRSTHLDTAILRIRLSGVDLSAQEMTGLHRLRILLADINAQTLEEEAFALLMDPGKRKRLRRIQGLLGDGTLEIRAAPLAGWSPDFSIFSDHSGPQALLMGLHWIQRPFPHRGPAWMASFGPPEARKGLERFNELWNGAHEIGPPIFKLLKRATSRWEREATPNAAPDREEEEGIGSGKTYEGEGRTQSPQKEKAVDTPPRLG